jgi:hypothetical protein
VTAKAEMQYYLIIQHTCNSIAHVRTDACAGALYLATTTAARHLHMHAGRSLRGQLACSQSCITGPLDVPIWLPGSHKRVYDRDSAAADCTSAGLAMADCSSPGR